MTVGLIIAGIALALFYGIYVSLVKKKNNLKEAAAGIDVSRPNNSFRKQCTDFG